MLHGVHGLLTYDHFRVRHTTVFEEHKGDHHTLEHGAPRLGLSQVKSIHGFTIRTGGSTKNTSVVERRAKRKRPGTDEFDAPARVSFDSPMLWDLYVDAHVIATAQTACRTQIIINGQFTQAFFGIEKSSSIASWW